MRAQCFFVVFLAVNGITEAYTFAAMNDKELERFGFLANACHILGGWMVGCRITERLCFTVIDK